MAVSCMRDASGHYRNSSFIVDLAMGQLPRSTERISSFNYFLFFSMTTVGAVLQPCRTCRVLFVILARCVVCVLGK